MRLLTFLAALIGLASAGALAAQDRVVPPPPPIDQENVWQLDLSTGGRVSIQLRPDLAPAHVERIKTLTRQGFYDGLIFHRVVEGFMAQGGDPTASGTGGSTLPDMTAEIKGLPHVRGAVGMARAQDPNSANSQFYIMFVPRLTMDNDYTVFGRVIRGMNFVDTIERGEPPLNPTRIVRASIGSDAVPEMSAEALRAAGQAAAARAAIQAPSLQLGGGTTLVPAPGASPAPAPAPAAPPEPAPSASPPVESPAPAPVPAEPTPAPPAPAPASPAADAPATPPEVTDPQPGVAEPARDPAPDAPPPAAPEEEPEAASASPE
jgi:cyclophilin family peptidyl-prolyl cis-trans isomerase